MTRYEVLHNAVLAVAEKARAILPPHDVHGIDHVQQHFRVMYTEKQLIEFVDLPWPKEVLRACAGSHLLVAGFPLSITEPQERQPDLFGQKISRVNFSCWYSDQTFAQDERPECRWYLLRKDWVPRSYRKRFRDQVKCLPSEEVIPFACEVAYATILHRLITGTWLHIDRYVRTGSHTSYGDRIAVGVRLKWGLCFGDHDDAPHLLGLASARKLPSLTAASL